MLIASFPAGPWETNCYVVATGDGTECVVIDPGHRAAQQVAELVTAHRLKPVAVLTTHGHLDHVFCVTPVCRSYAMPAWIHPADRAMLADPYGGLGPEAEGLIAHLTGSRDAGLVEPDEVRELSDGGTVEAAGLAFAVTHAPGHTPGSVLFAAPYADTDGRPLSEEVGEVVFTGDVVFAGSVGRTDLPGGDAAAMRNSLRDKVLALDDRCALLPGHGPQTTMARERTGNPYLQPEALA